MAEDPDHLKELLRVFNAEKVEYMIVGGHAVMRYTEPYYTKDFDIWVGNSPENATRVYRALATFGAPVDDDKITPESFQDENLFYLLGNPPTRIDIIGGISGVKFYDAWPHRAADTYLGESVYFISVEDLVKNKIASGRPSDLEHVKHIEREQQRKKKSK
jgi:hypothetical protein